MTDYTNEEWQALTQEQRDAVWEQIDREERAAKLQMALRANDNTYKTSPRTGRTYGVCKGLWK